MTGLAAGTGAGHGVDDSAGAAGDQGYQQNLRVAGGGVLVGGLAQVGAGCRVVGDIEAGAVDRDHQQAGPAGTGRADRGRRSAQQVEQCAHRAYTEPGAGVPQRGAGDLGYRQGPQRGGEPGPHREVSTLLEQRRGQQQTDHHPGR